jgi:hypothetical protein
MEDGVAKEEAVAALERRLQRTAAEKATEKATHDLVLAERRKQVRQH